MQKYTGNNLRYLRGLAPKALHQKALATLIETEQATISRLEGNKFVPSVHMVGNLLWALNEFGVRVPITKGANGKHVKRRRVVAEDLLNFAKA